MEDKIKFIIPGKPEYLTMVRLAIGSIADTAQFNMDEIEDIQTAVGEACKAICCHGKENIAGEFTLECILKSDAIEIYVTATGEKEVGKSLLTMKSHDCPNEGDLGAFEMKTLMTSAEIIKNADCKKTIKMTKKK